MGHIVGDEVNVSLDLMHHCICVGHAGPVLHAGTPVSANHMINLFLDFSYEDMIKKWYICHSNSSLYEV